MLEQNLFPYATQDLLKFYSMKILETLMFLGGQREKQKFQESKPPVHCTAIIKKPRKVRKEDVRSLLLCS